MIPVNIIAIKAQFTGTRITNWEEVDFKDDDIPF